MKVYNFSTSLSKNELVIALKDLTNPKNDTKSFCGEVFQNEFSIMKYQKFCNNVLNPYLKGKISENHFGTNIQVSAKLSKSDRIGFSALLALSLCVILFLVIFGIIQNTYGFIEPIVALISFELFIAGVGYILFSFKSKKVITEFMKYFDK